MNLEVSSVAFLQHHKSFNAFDLPESKRSFEDPDGKDNEEVDGAHDERRGYL